MSGAATLTPKPERVLQLRRRAIERRLETIIEGLHPPSIDYHEHVVSGFHDPAKKAIVHLFITTSSQTGSEFVEVDDTSDSARDLKTIFYDSNKYAVEFVDSADRADITLEVMGRSRRQDGDSKTLIVPNGFGGFVGRSRSTAQSVLFIRMKIGMSYVKDFVGESRSRYWRAAAADAVDQIGRWINANRDQIITKRSDRLVPR
jgi:hypothetical protein